MNSAGFTARGSISDLLLAGAAVPGRPFLVTEEGQVTYVDQLLRARRMAAALVGLGVRRGDRVHVQLGNCPGFYDLWFATALTGMILVPTSPQLAADEIGHVYADAEPTLSVVEPAALDAAAHAARARSSAVRVVALADATATAERSSPIDLAPAASDQPAAILYTSGTTSRPKGVVITGANYAAVGRAVASVLGLQSHDRWLVTLPLFHANAQYYCTMSALVTGASIGLTSRFSASGWGRQARELKATLASLFAAPIRMILTTPPDARDRDNLVRTVLYAQNVSTAQAAEFEKRFATRLVQLYGMTETVLPPTMNPDNDGRRWDSIGRPLAGVELRLEAVGDHATPDTGELWMRGVPGQTLAAGYWRNADATQESFAGGWLRTGDLVYRDADGFYYFVDRAKDMIKRAGENVSAGEIERVANEHPQVLESAAIGVPDPVMDQAIVLVLVRRTGAILTADEILSWCGQRLSRYKVPSEVVFVDELPRTSVGKVRKNEIRAGLTTKPAPLTTRPIRSSFTTQTIREC